MLRLLYKINTPKINVARSATRVCCGVRKLDAINRSPEFSLDLIRNKKT